MEYRDTKQILDQIDSLERKIKRSFFYLFARKKRKFHLEWCERKRDMVINPEKYFPEIQNEQNSKQT
jgi:hypothetical protein